MDIGEIVEIGDREVKTPKVREPGAPAPPAPPVAPARKPERVPA